MSSRTFRGTMSDARNPRGYADFLYGNPACWVALVAKSRLLIILTLAAKAKSHSIFQSRAPPNARLTPDAVLIHDAAFPLACASVYLDLCPTISCHEPHSQLPRRLLSRPPL